MDPSVVTSWEADEMSAEEYYERQEKMNRLENELELRTEEAMKKAVMPSTNWQVKNLS